MPKRRSPAMHRRNINRYRGSKICRKQVTLGRARVHTKIGVLIPEDLECLSDVSEAARSAAAAGKRVWMSLSRRILVGEF